MLKKLLKMLLGSHSAKPHYRKFSSSDYKYRKHHHQGPHHNQYGSSYYKKKLGSSSFFSS